jgi:hypothetical protein
VTGHFDCIGLTARTGDELGELLDRLAERGAETERPDGGRMVTWTDPSGARLTFHVTPDGEMECATPGFAASPRVEATLRGIVEDGECPHCDRVQVEVLEKGTMCYPMAVQVEDMPLARGGIADGRAVRLAVAAFPEEMRAHKNDAAYLASQKKEVKFAAQSLIPSGLWSSPPTAHVLMAGRVVSSRTLANGATGREFVHAVVRTFGTEIDVVAPPAMAPDGLEAGMIVRGTFWVVARLGAAPEE